MGGGEPKRKEYDDGRTGETVQWRKPRWDERVPEAVKHIPQWGLVQDYFMVKDALKRRAEKAEGGKIIRDDLRNPSPNEEMIPERIYGGRDAPYQVPPFDPMAHALNLELLKRLGVMDEGTRPSF